jgi:hypothetical protein
VTISPRATTQTTVEATGSAMQGLNTPSWRRGDRRGSDGTAADEPAKRGTMRRGVKGGSDGTRTRDLRRDRPAF